MKLSGAQAIIKVLLEQGVDTVFGYPGGQVIPLYNALYDAPLRNVLTAHEQGAVHAADGYARASGRTGVCIATSGGGDKYRYGTGYCLFGFCAAGSDHRSGFGCQFRARLLSGNRYCRGDAADNEI